MDVTQQSPANGAIDVEKETPVVILFTDDVQVVKSSIVITVRGQSVYTGAANQFAAGYGQSTITPNATNGYDVSIVPDRAQYWGDGERISVYAEAEDNSSNQDSNLAEFYGEERNPFLKIYPMLIKSIRQQDEQG